MRGIKQGTKGEGRKMSVKQYVFCEIKFILDLAAFLRLLFQNHMKLWLERVQNVLLSINSRELRLSKNWSQRDFPPGKFKHGEGDSDMGFSSQRPSSCSEKLLQNRSRRDRCQGAAHRHSRCLPEGHPVPAAEFSAPAHWAVTAHIESPETCCRSAVTLIFSSLFFCYLQQSWKMKLGNTHMGTSLLRSNLWKHLIYQV